MGLAERLDALRGGVPSARVPDRPLAERVARLAVARSGVTKETLGTTELAKRCGGEKVGDGVVLIEHQRSLPEVALGQPDRQRWLYLDTETTGLAGGSGTRVFLLGLARLQSGRLHSRQYLLARIGGESALLAHAAGWLRAEERLVSYNGKSFDLPLLATRYRLAGLADPFAGRDHLDLLHRVRRAYAGRWQDCRLASAERRLLGIERHDDLPGSQAPEAWLQWLRTGRSDALVAVCRHNLQDLHSLPSLLQRLTEVYRRPTEFAADLLAIARGHRRDGLEHTALALLRRHRDALDGDGRVELARLERRVGRDRQLPLALNSCAAGSSHRSLI